MRRRRTRGALVGVLALLVGWLVACFILVGRPRVDHPTRADAVVVLGSPEENGRLVVAQQLLDNGVASTIVVSMNSDNQQQARRLCEGGRLGITVLCFRPDPATTRGEAEHVRDLVAQHHWRHIVVVTSTYHVSRARMIFRRCFDGELQLVAARDGIGLDTWAYEYLYQSGAYAKALLQSGC